MGGLCSCKQGRCEPDPFEETDGDDFCQILSKKETEGVHPAIESLRDAAAKSVVVLAGAGISVSAGIPDFRSPGTGLYDNLQKYKLPHPQAVFDLSYFRQHPEAFTQLATELWPSNFSPTLAHWFVRLLQDKGLLRRHYTQNIDGLDHAAGIHDDLLVEAHGSFGAGHCVDCDTAYTADFIRKLLLQGTVVKCTRCKGLVKPDIVFFGEGLPDKFFKYSDIDLKTATTVICIGTSLTVMPFASLADKGKSPNARHILMNRDIPASYAQRKSDLILLGDSDAKVLELADRCGWKRELLELVALNKKSSKL